MDKKNLKALQKTEDLLKQSIGWTWKIFMAFLYAIGYIIVLLGSVASMILLSQLYPDIYSRIISLVGFQMGFLFGLLFFISKALVWFIVFYGIFYFLNIQLNKQEVNK